MKLTPTDLNRALELAKDRGILASALGSADQRQTFARSVRANAVFSARVANADYLTTIFNEVAALLQGGYEDDLPMVRIRLKRLLQRLGYTPETGFPGDEELGIPPAEAGSLQDLSSDARLNLIVETQTGLMRGRVRREQDLSPASRRMFPWWQLVRVEWRRVPRGLVESGSIGWPTRWVKAGGPEPVAFKNSTLLIAPKDHPVWANLGDSALFPDALDVDHPPFAFRSGFGWRQVHWTEGRDMGLDLPAYVLAKPAEDEARSMELPKPKASTKRISKPVLTELEKALEESLAETGGRIRSTSDILSMQ